METWQEEMQRIEEVIHKSDGDGVRARWESGRYMLTLKQGKKQLPKGVLDELAEKLDVSRSELTARMKFAAKYTTDAELTDVIREFRTWFAITHEALTDTPRIAGHADADDAGDDDQHADHDDNDNDKLAKADHRRARRDLLRTIKVIEEIDPTTLNEGDQDLLAQLAQVVERLKAGVVTLGRAA